MRFISCSYVSSEEIKLAKPFLHIKKQHHIYFTLNVSVTLGRCEYTKARCLAPLLTVLASGSCDGITTPAPDVAHIVCNALAASTCYDDGIILCGSDGITYSNS
ncbi:hypothetical protein ElyMa_004465700 [Elysia marginata]|uniref:Uncharacterized protein n=1 Tax=Elysia marginata TaxID=1093978 RepID=A0AAV4HFE4_9GAST|nr:hypothetical protein ElyMa_004465700 [Elysia marginata]